MSAENCHIFVDLTLEKCYAKNTPTWSRKEMESEQINTSEIYCIKSYYSVLIFGKLLSINVSMNEILLVTEGEKKL